MFSDRQAFPKRRKTRSTGEAAGFSLVEVMIASFLVLLIFFGLAQTQQRGWAILAMSETYRQATLVAGMRIDELRVKGGYRDLGALDGTSEAVTLGGRDFTIGYVVDLDDPVPESATVEVTVGWTEVVNGNDVARSVSCASVLGRSVYWPE